MTNSLSHPYKNPPARLGRIRYINVNPVYYNFDHEQVPEDIQITKEAPAVLNRMLKDAELDISSVSTSAFARHSDQWLLLPDLSIACFGKVMSVLLVSRYPMDALTGRKVLLTQDSATAVDLVKLIFAENNVSPEFETGILLSPLDLPETADAGLVIGDAALKYPWDRHFPHVWDLCEIWNQITGLPFVFAVWAVRKAYAEKYPHQVDRVHDLLQNSKKHGLSHLEEIARESARQIGIDPEVSKIYFNSMYYHMDAPDRNCLVEFFNRLYHQKLVDRRPVLNFFDPKRYHQAV